MTVYAKTLAAGGAPLFSKEIFALATQNHTERMAESRGLGYLYVDDRYTQAGGLTVNLGGILLGLLSGVSYAAYNILTKISMRRGSSPISTTLYSFFFLSVIALAVADPISIVEHTAKKPTLLLPLTVALGVVTFVLPYLFFTLGMRALPAGTASALSVVEPMAATVFGILLLHEPVEPLALVGIFVILLSVVLMGRAEGNTSPRKTKK